MESKLKAAAQDSVGELPSGYLHLPTTPIKQGPELTDWISVGLKPFMHGVYEIDYDERVVTDADPCYSCWNGRFWGFVSYTKEIAFENSEYRSCIIIKKWRGLAKNPEVQS